MALGAPLLALTRTLNATKMKRGAAFVLGDAEPATAAATLGRIRDTSFTMEPVMSSEDSTGRQSTMGYKVTVNITMMQTDAAGILAALELASPSAGNDGQNGFNILLLNAPSTSAAAITKWNGTLTFDMGIGFKHAIVQVKPNLKFDGTESDTTLTITGTVDASQAAALATSSKIDFDAA